VFSRACWTSCFTRFPGSRPAALLRRYRACSLHSVLTHRIWRGVPSPPRQSHRRISTSPGRPQSDRAPRSVRPPTRSCSRAQRVVRTFASIRIDDGVSQGSHVAWRSSEPCDVVILQPRHRFVPSRELVALAPILPHSPSISDAQMSGLSNQRRHQCAATAPTVHTSTSAGSPARSTRPPPPTMLNG
jgi:hypothetical protein